MTAAPTNDDDLGLNLVFTPPSLIASSTTTTGTGGGIITTTNKKPKRKTKYDKRRERGKLAKAAKDEEKRKKREHQQREGGGGLYNTKSTQLQEGRHDTKLGDGDDIDDGGERKVSSLVSIAAALNGSVSDNNKKKAIAYTTPPVAESKVAAENQLGGEHENDVKTGTQVVGKVGMKEDDLRVPRPKIESASSAVVPRESLPIEPTPPTASQPVEDTSSSSRKHRVRVLYITHSFIFTNMHILCTLLLFSMTRIYVHMQTYHHET